MKTIFEKYPQRPAGVELRYDFRSLRHKSRPIAWASDSYKELLKITG